MDSFPWDMCEAFAQDAYDETKTESQQDVLLRAARASIYKHVMDSYGSRIIEIAIPPELDERSKGIIGRELWSSFKYTLCTRDGQRVKDALDANADYYKIILRE